MFKTLNPVGKRRTIRAWTSLAVLCVGAVLTRPPAALYALGLVVSTLGACGMIWCLASWPESSAAGESRVRTDR